MPIHCNHDFNDYGYVLIAPEMAMSNPNSVLETEVCVKCGLLKATSKELIRLQELNRGKPLKERS